MPGPLRLDAAAVTVNLFETLGVGAALGRTLVSADQRGPTTTPVVLSDRLWRSTFGGRLDVLGAPVTLNGVGYAVVGVMPRGFDFPRRGTDLWVPLTFAPDDLADRANVYLQAIARLRPEVSLAEARGELNVIAQGLARAFPEANDRTGATVIQLRDEVSRQSRLMLLALVGASLCVLLIACANLASLLLARAVERQRELTVRVAMGARPRRLARQLLTESLTLSTAGGVIGVALALLAVPAAAALVPTTLPIAEAPSADWRMLAVAALATVVTGLGFGLVPAWRIARNLQGAELRHGTRVVGSGATERLRAGFVVAEVAAAVVLLVTVGLFLRALWRVQDVDPGFRADGVLTARTTLPMPKYEATATREQFYARILAEVTALPGVSSAAYTSFLPMVMRGGIWPVLTGNSAAPADARMASVRYVTPDYFATLAIPLLRGRDVTRADRQTSQYVAVVSRAFAAAHWPGQEPLGQRFSIALQDRVVVGVVGDVRVRGLERESEPQVYLPSAQVPDGGIIFYAPKDLVIRTAGAPAALVAAVRSAVATRRSRTAGVRRADAGRHRPSRDLAAVGATGGADGLRGRGGAAGEPRHPQSALLHRGRARAGDRRAHGTRRQPGAGAGPGAAPHRGAGRRGRGRWPGGRVRGEPVAAVPAGRRESRPTARRSRPPARWPWPWRSAPVSCRRCERRASIRWWPPARSSRGGPPGASLSRWIPRPRRCSQRSRSGSACWWRRSAWPCCRCRRCRRSASSSSACSWRHGPTASLISAGSRWP